MNLFYMCFLSSYSKLVILSRSFNMSNFSDFSDTVYAIQHVAFEDLGTWEDVFYELGMRVRYFEAGIDDLSKVWQHQGVVVVLGGPIGVQDRDDFPFLAQEIQGLNQRLAQKLPTIGICLGAQLMAKSLGAQVYKGHYKEIGWSVLDSINVSSVLAPLTEIPVLHWHGDTFDLPTNAQLLASSEHYPHQAFSIENYALALQFHPEVSAEHLEKWLIGHAYELAHSQISIQALREDHQRYAPQLAQASRQVLQTFMQSWI